MRISEAAEATGVSSKRIRYYEQIGLIKPAPRTDSGYRDYAASDIHTLIFVQRARELGFSIDETSTLLELWRDQNATSREVRDLAKSHIDEMRDKIRRLQSMVDTLQQLVSDCDGGSRSECPILRDLEHAPVKKGATR